MNKLTVFLAFSGVLTGFTLLTPDPGAVAQAQGAPIFHYDPTWPKPLPNLWKLGGVTGLAVDSLDDADHAYTPNGPMAADSQRGGLLEQLANLR